MGCGRGVADTSGHLRSGFDPPRESIKRRILRLDRRTTSCRVPFGLYYSAGLPSLRMACGTDAAPPTGRAACTLLVPGLVVGEWGFYFAEEPQCMRI